MSSKRLLSIDKIPGTAKKLRNRLSVGLGISDSQDAPQPSILTSNGNNQSSLSHQASSATEPVFGSVSDTQKLWDADKTNSTAWRTLQAALEGLENCSGVFPPLKLAIEGLSQCIREIPEANRRRQEYCDLASDLEFAVDSLTEHVKESQSAKMSNCVLNLINAIQKELRYINKEQQKGFLSRIAKAEQQNEQLVRCYRRIETRLRQLEINACLSVWSILHEHIANARLDRLSPAKHARFNSAQSQSIRRRRCNPNTRATVLTNLRVWSLATCSPKLYWMNGMAGTGKTTIAFSFCEALEGACQLGASFFCSRLLPDCRDVNKIIPTIAYQLADFSYPFRTNLCDVLATMRDIATYDLDSQFEMLLRKPLLGIQNTMPENIAVVIDALDECLDPSGTKLILDLLFRNAATLPIKFFVASRPEPTISRMIQVQDQCARETFVLHELPQEIVEADIETYLSTELAGMLPPPTRDQIRQLAQQAGNLFIYAATAVRYIRPEGLAVNCHQRLSLMLGMASNKQSTNKHKELDLLYEDILASALEHQGWESWEAQNILAVLHTVICVKEPTTSGVIASLLKWEDESEVQLALEHLRSVIQVSDWTGHISALHASFPEYILTQQRSGRFFCNESHHRVLALGCFEVMRSSLRFNICDLESSYVPNYDVPNLAERVKQAITAKLFYVCRYWGHHLDQSKAISELCVELHDFLSTHLLFYIEAMHLKGDLDTVVTTLQRVIECHKEHEIVMRTYPLLQDAHDFATHVKEDLMDTPHIYLSALAFWPKDRPIAIIYRKYFTRIITPHFRTPITENNDGFKSNLPVTYTRLPLLLESSRDGNRIISGCGDGLICVWDSQTGANISRIYNWNTHGFSLAQMNFCSDGCHIICGSHAWDIQIGIVYQFVQDPVDSDPYIRVLSKCLLDEQDLFVKLPLIKQRGVREYPRSKIANIPYGDGPSSIIAISPEYDRIVGGYSDGTIRPFRRETTNDEVWSMNVLGLVKNARDNRILFWVPVQLRNRLGMPQNILLIRKGGKMVVEVDGIPLGEQWQQCYTGPLLTASG